MAIAFADLVGFVRFTEEEGEQEALDLRRDASSSRSRTRCPRSARVVKNIGDGVMIVGNDPVALTDWAIGFQEGFERRSRPAHRRSTTGARCTATATTTGATSTSPRAWSRARTAARCS